MTDVPGPGALKWALLGVASLAATGVGCAAGAPASFADARGDGTYNVVVITVDTLRADRLGAYGFDGVATPAIDRLAREGILFDNAQTTAPLTLPAHTSLFTGNYPLFHGVRDNGGFLVPEEAETLAEVLRARVSHRWLRRGLRARQALEPEPGIRRLLR